MNGMGNWQYPALFLGIMANVAVIMGVLSCILVAEVKGCDMMSVADLIFVMLSKIRNALLGGF